MRPAAAAALEACSMRMIAASSGCTGAVVLFTRVLEAPDSQASNCTVRRAPARPRSVDSSARVRLDTRPLAPRPAPGAPGVPDLTPSASADLELMRASLLLESDPSAAAQRASNILA